MKRSDDYSFLARQTRHRMNIFDIDETIVVTEGVIRVTDHETNEEIVLTPQEFNDYERKANHQIDFTDFQDPEILRAGHIIDWVFDILKKTLAKDKAVGIITARDDRDLIYNFLLENGVDINPDFIFAISDPTEFDITESIAERKKQALQHIIDMDFTDLKFFDDNKENLELAETLDTEHNRIRVRTKHIKQEWIPRI